MNVSNHADLIAEISKLYIREVAGVDNTMPASLKSSNDSIILTVPGLLRDEVRELADRIVKAIDDSRLNVRVNGQSIVVSRSDKEPIKSASQKVQDLGMKIMSELNNACYDYGVRVFGYSKGEAMDIMYCTAFDEGERYEFTLHAELDFDDTLELIDAVLNPIIVKYDEAAYFDMEAPGLSVAYVEKQNVSGATGYFDDDGSYQVILDERDKRLARLAKEVEGIVKDLAVPTVLPSEFNDYFRIECVYDDNSVVVHSDILPEYFNYEEAAQFIEKTLFDKNLEIYADGKSIVLHYLNDVAAASSVCGYYNIPEQPIDPPADEYDVDETFDDDNVIGDPVACIIDGYFTVSTDNTSGKKVIEVEAEYSNDLVTVDPTYVDSSGDVYVETNVSELGELKVGDNYDIEYDAFDMIEGYLENNYSNLADGRYHATGNIDMVYNVKGVILWKPNFSKLESFYDTDRIDTVVNKNLSKVTKFQVELVSKNTRVESIVVHN